jgi:hypothetical protein
LKEKSRAEVFLILREQKQFLYIGAGCGKHDKTPQQRGFVTFYKEN